MDLMLTTEMPAFPFRLTHKEKILMAGSCFSENIGECMLQRGFGVMVNPWGILFNPISLSELMGNVLGMTDELPVRPVKRDGLWMSLFQHSRIHASSEEGLLERLKEDTAASKEWAGQCEFFIVTFGTANVFVETDSGKVVANCHKQPSSMFSRRMLTVDEVVQAWKDILHFAANKRFIFTVSPVRHSRDGLHANNLSKSTLLLAVDQLCTMFPERCHYFPAYELVMDELRDYRFYKEDMVHPNEMAVKYVWEKWSSAVYPPETLALAARYHRLVQQAMHRPLFVQSDTRILLRKRLRDEALQLQDECKWLDMNYLLQLLADE